MHPITIVAEPSRFTGPVPAHRPASNRELNAYDEFARQLAMRSGGRVDILEDRLCAAPPSGIVLLDATADLDRVLSECPPADAAALPRRLLLMNADRSAVLDLLERYKPPWQWFAWRPSFVPRRLLRALFGAAELSALDANLPRRR